MLIAANANSTPPPCCHNKFRHVILATLWLGAPPFNRKTSPKLPSMDMKTFCSSSISIIPPVPSKLLFWRKWRGLSARWILQDPKSFYQQALCEPMWTKGTKACLVPFYTGCWYPATVKKTRSEQQSVKYDTTHLPHCLLLGLDLFVSATPLAIIWDSPFMREFMCLLLSEQDVIHSCNINIWVYNHYRSLTVTGYSSLTY